MTPAQVFGDPEAMRALARELANRADLLSSIPAGFNTALGSATFEGGAATRLRGTADATLGRVVALADELRTVAANVFSDARTVEQRNADAAAQAQADADADAEAEA